MTELPFSRPPLLTRGKNGCMVPIFPRMLCLSLTTCQDLDHIPQEKRTQSPLLESLVMSWVLLYSMVPARASTLNPVLVLQMTSLNREAKHSTESPLREKGLIIREPGSQRGEAACPRNYGLNSHKTRERLQGSTFCLSTSCLEHLSK